MVEINIRALCSRSSFLISFFILFFSWVLSVWRMFAVVCMRCHCVEVCCWLYYICLAASRWSENGCALLSSSTSLHIQWAWQIFGHWHIDPLAPWFYVFGWKWYNEWSAANFNMGQQYHKMRIIVCLDFLICLGNATPPPKRNVVSELSQRS